MAGFVIIEKIKRKNSLELMTMSTEEEQVPLEFVLEIISS